MTTEIRKILNKDIPVIISDEGKVFKRISDGFIFGNEIYLGIEFSSGEPRQDMPEYYEEIDEVVLG